MGLISLQGMEFFAYHGCHEEEQKTGNRFIVDVEFFTASENAEITDDLSKTINYQQVYQIVRNEMEIRSYLVEHVARRIMDSLFRKFPEIGDTKITVAKLNPPLGGKVDKVQFSLQRKA